jgi:hypothetical protein
LFASFACLGSPFLLRKKKEYVPRKRKERVRRKGHPRKSKENISFEAKISEEKKRKREAREIKSPFKR